MKIQFSPELLAYKDKKPFDVLTVDHITTKGSCCKILVSKVSIGLPKKDLNAYTQYEAYGVLIYVSKLLTFNESIHFTYSRLLMREMIECHGYEIQRSASLF